MSEKLANEAIVDHAVASIKSLRVDGGEVFLRDGQSTTVEIRDGQLENAITRGERGIGIRVLRGGRVGFAYSSDLSPDGIELCVTSARDIASVTEPDPDVSIATQKVENVDLGLYEAGIDDRPVDARTDVALAVERAAKAVDPRISGFRKTTYSDGTMTTMIATTAGVRGAYRETYFSVGTSAVATAGEERQIGYFGDAKRQFAAIDPEAVGRRSAALAVGKLGARPFKTQTLPIVLDPYMGMSLLGAIVPLFSADSVIKGKSLFAGKVGTQVASAAVTIVDDARRPGALRSAPFDGEGVATSTRTLVDEGVLRGYLTSLKTAKKLDHTPTGNARRGSYASPSRIGAANFHLAAGSASPEALVNGLDRSLRITSLLNLHTIDPISGEFSLGATGDYLENGERTYPVQGITIAGNLTSLLASITGVANDLTFGAAGLGSPTFVISELSIGGV
ncbi:MAG TPA: TldD/PmbA family protein [Candidatus Limnocylindria bacterium]|nr:TldD/PmbA family protein [Candidatus Limnocylindria bacterium]